MAGQSAQRKAKSPVPPRSAGRKPPRRPSKRRMEYRRKRRQRWATGAAIGLVVAVVAVLVGIKLSSGPSPSSRVSTVVPAAPGASAHPGYSPPLAPASVVSEVAAVPTSLLARRSGSVGVTPAKAITGPALVSHGKPEVLYIGAEYCPYCAAERWGVVTALSKFGTWSHLGAVHSASNDVYANTQTFSFYKASYTSRYLNFTGVETATNQPQASGGYAPLQTPTTAQRRVFQANDSQGSIPFVDIGGKSLIVGASYDPGVLHGLSMPQIASQLRVPSSKVAQEIDTTAGMIARRVCSLTGGHPGKVCAAIGAGTKG